MWVHFRFQRRNAENSRPVLHTSHYSTGKMAIEMKDLVFLITEPLSIQFSEKPDIALLIEQQLAMLVCHEPVLNIPSTNSRTIIRSQSISSSDRSGAEW